MTNSKTIKPEVGQVWEYEDSTRFMIYKKYLIDVTLGTGELVRDGQYRFEILELSNGEIESNFQDEYSFMVGRYKYIGKAKGALSDLFEVKDGKH